ncbi:hypothetical protein ACO2Q8_01010 [Larkinella sp. VNQ87]|uniref:hypothetical protein n=1 Tax=Larkinella sp. VNQ87 TaxID=3400921 RepID=UPI003BFB8389
MKTQCSQLTQLVSGLLFVLLLFTNRLALAQTDDLASGTTDKGYWKLQTDYATRSTVIQFFNAHNEPVYQETLPGKYVKLTKRNMRLFDEMLDRMVNSHLLASQVKSYDLLASSETGFSKTSPMYRFSDPSSSVLPATNKRLTVNPLVNPFGKLRINFANPEQKRIAIELTDELSKIVFYSETSRLEGYNRYLNISNLLSGTYRLQLTGAGSRVAYWLTIDRPNRQYALKPAP